MAAYGIVPLKLGHKFWLGCPGCSLTSLHKASVPAEDSACSILVIGTNVPHQEMTLGTRGICQNPLTQLFLMRTSLFASESEVLWEFLGSLQELYELNGKTRKFFEEMSNTDTALKAIFGLCTNSLFYIVLEQWKTLYARIWRYFLIYFSPIVLSILLAWLFVKVWNTSSSFNSFCRSLT